MLTIKVPRGKLTAKTGAGNINLQYIYGSFMLLQVQGNFYVKFFPNASSAVNLKHLLEDITLSIPGDSK